MPAVTRDRALEMLTDEVRSGLAADELLEVYDEVFPHHPHAGEGAGTRPLQDRLARHINGGLGADELVELWRLILPRHRNVWYDEEEDRVHFNEEPEAVPSE